MNYSPQICGVYFIFSLQMNSTMNLMTWQGGASFIDTREPILLQRKNRSDYFVTSPRDQFEL